MSPIETVVSDLERNWSMVDRTLEEVDDMGLGNQPNGQSNSIGWLLWYMSRVVNRFSHIWCQDAPQLCRGLGNFEDQPPDHQELCAKRESLRGAAQPVPMEVTLAQNGGEPAPVCGQARGSGGGLNSLHGGDYRS